jgi:hypothetical protein
MHIREIQKDIYSLAKKQGLWKNPPSIPECLAMVHAELSEAYEEYKNGYIPDHIYTFDGIPQGIPIELADAVILIMSISEHYGIDLQDAIRLKHLYNEERKR